MRTWPGYTFRFTIGATGALTVTVAGQQPRQRQVAADSIVGTDASGDSAVDALAGTEPGERRTGSDSSAGSQAADADHFYLLLSELARRAGGPRLLRDSTGAQDWPPHGVYFFFEDGDTQAAARWSASALMR